MGEGVQLVKATRAKPGGFVPPDAEELALLFPEFETFEAIGQGGMGAVYKTRQRELDRTVAVKILPPEIAADPEFTERFRREAATLARLDHPNIVRLFDYGQRECFAYFVMEFVDGVDLSRRIASGPMPAEDAFRIVGQICDALQHSHERGVLHRDIKPSNILIAADGRVKVADFGLARLVQPETGEGSLTRTRATLGTPRYMAPEQMAGAKETDQRVDIYALGVVLYELLTGEVPLGHFDPPSGKVATINPRIDEVVLCALSSEPNRRFATASELKARLREAIEKPAPSRAERSRALAWRALLASLIAAGAGFGIALLLSIRNGHMKEGVAVRKESSAVSSLPSGRLVSFGAAAPPSPIVGERAVAVAMAVAGNEFGLIVRPDRTVRAWGSNRFGQTNVPPHINNAVAVAVGQGERAAHALVLQVDGLVAGWGDNTFHQARPPRDLTEVVAISAGEFHSLALTRQGRVVAWGHQGNGAAVVPTDLPPARAIAAGAAFSGVLFTNGQLAAWGANDAGQCNVPRPDAPVVEIAFGTKHGLARLADGRVVAWGDNRAGQCNVPANLPAVTRIFAGGQGSAAIDETGQLHPWGKVPPGLERLSGRIIDLAIGASIWIMIEADKTSSAQ